MGVHCLSFLLLSNKLRKILWLLTAINEQFISSQLCRSEILVSWLISLPRFPQLQSQVICQPVLLYIGKLCGRNCFYTYSRFWWNLFLRVCKIGRCDSCFLVDWWLGVGLASRGNPYFLDHSTFLLQSEQENIIKSFCFKFPWHLLLKNFSSPSFSHFQGS